MLDSKECSLLSYDGNGRLLWTSACIEGTFRILGQRWLRIPGLNGLLSGIYLSCSDRVLVLTERQGDLLAVPLDASSISCNPPSEATFELSWAEDQVARILRPHGRGGAVCIVRLSPRLYATSGRDGRYCTYSIEYQERNALKLELLTASKAARNMEWIERVR